MEPLPAANETLLPLIFLLLIKPSGGAYHANSASFWNIDPVYFTKEVHT